MSGVGAAEGGDRRGLWSVLALAGLVPGGVLLGGGVSLAHVASNQVASVPDALVVLGWCVAVYGTAGAMLVLGFGLATAALERAARGTVTPARAVFVGLAAAIATLGFLTWSYGLTYDELPAFVPRTPAGMIAVLAARALAAAAGAAALAALLARARALGGAVRGSVRAPALAVVALVAAHAGVALLGAGPRAAAEAAREPPGTVPAGGAGAPHDPGLDVILLGFDGADWRVLAPLMRRGAAPGFTALARAGATAALTTLPDANSAVIWASIYTGLRPRAHGVHDFYTVRLPGMSAESGLFPIHRTFFKEAAGYLEPLGLARRDVLDRRALAAPPLWEVADRAGRSIGVIGGFYFTYPAYRPTAARSFVVGHGLRKHHRSRGPAGDDVGALATFVQPVGVYTDVRRRLDDLGGRPWRYAFALDVLARRPPRLLHVYSREPDKVSHLLWHRHQPELFLGGDAADVDADGDPVVDAYRRMDAFVADVRARVGPDTVVVVCSDHGQSATLFHDASTQHRHGPPGILAIGGGPIRAGRRLDRAHVLDVFPTVLYLLGLPIPRDGAGQVLTEVIDPGFLAAHPIRWVDSYGRGTGPNVAHSAPGWNAREIDRLHALGYVP